MEIEFEFVDKQSIKIIGVATTNYESVIGDDGKPKMEPKVVRKTIGNIFTPSGSGHTYKNAIQVCGFTEAFDLWGCANYQTFKTSADGLEYEKVNPKRYDFPVEIFDAFDTETRAKIINLFREANKKEYNKAIGNKVVIQCKDIQLRFPHPEESMDSVIYRTWDSRNCNRCFNKECECENKGRHTVPFDVKRANDLHLEPVTKGEPLPHKI